MSADIPVPVFDDHFHLDPRGRVQEAVKDFARAGGTHLMLVHKPYGVARTVDDHREAMATTLRLAERAREAADVQVWVAVSPHPAEFTKLLDLGVPPPEAMEIQRGALQVAAEHVAEGRAVALSEVGRPHWRPVDADVMAAANELMEEAFATAADLGCPVQIHAETATPESFADLAEHLDVAGLPRDRAVKHFSTPILDLEANHGLWPSVIVGDEQAEEAARQGTRFLMETDYMDDPDRPGAVLGPKTVPRRTRDLLEKEVLDEEALWRVHVDNVEEIYGVEVRT